MFILVRTLGPDYQLWTQNIAVSRDRDALEVIRVEDIKELEKLKQERFQHNEIVKKYSARFKELEEANPFTIPQPPRRPPKCKVSPVTREEQEARAELKLKVFEVFSEWCDEADRHREPYRQQAKAEITMAHNLPDDFSFDSYYTAEWMWEEPHYRIEEVREVGSGGQSESHRDMDPKGPVEG
ncbi:MAG: hypothetical protein ACXAC5_03865 [Promethearchaeota archaeon]|jgi:hypothetical protein